MISISTQVVNCKDCHRCVRSCPVKAIGIAGGHARVVWNKCIMCGRCVIECPQQAKVITDGVPEVKQAISEGKKVVLSIAPSYVSAFPDMDSNSLIRSLYGLGFSYVEETAVGAEVVAYLYSKLLETSNKPIISSCCPVIVSLITKYYHDLVELLAPVSTPMLAHGKMFKDKFGDECYVVFVGPCVGKITECYSYNSVDSVLTFTQLRAWLNEVNDCHDVKLVEPPIMEINRESMLPKNLIDGVEWGQSRKFPITGGVLHSMLKDYNPINSNFLAINGIERCMEVFDGMVRGEIAPRFVEAMACVGGCIGGPGNISNQCTPTKRFAVIKHTEEQKPYIPVNLNLKLDYSRYFVPQLIDARMPTEEDIRNILQQTGKFSPADEKNCGACGYNSCREKAIAVYQGLAEIDMCVPYMRSKAESLADIIVDNSLDAIIVVNDKMEIEEFNPAAERMFNRSKAMVRGVALSQIMDSTDVFEVASTGNKIVGKRVEYPEYRLITEHMVIPVPDHGLIILVITDITARERQTTELAKMKLETVEKATEIINKQMHVAQEIAGLLGETTAETKATLLELIWLLKDKNKEEN